MLFLALATIAIFWRHLFAGYTFPLDFEATSKWAVFLTNTVGRGNFTEWNPFAGGGLPIPYNAGSGLYFPVWWILGTLHIPPTVTTLNVIQAVHVFLGSAGVFFLARSLGLERRFALLAATAFLFFGGHYSNGQHDLIVRGNTYAPWLLWTLTPPAGGRRWGRILALPLWTWVVGSGSYPGQTVAFLEVSALYLAIQMWVNRDRFREFAPYLAPSLLSAVAVLAALLYPSAAAGNNGELYRPFPPTQQMRALFALHPRDIFGLYLDPFAWDVLPSLVTGWAVGVVVLVGIVCIRTEEVRRSLPLIAAGVAAFLLAFLPSWPPAGRLMASAPLLFPSRLPASDSKAMAGVALVCLGALGWSRLAAGGRPGPWPALLGALLVAGIWLAPQNTDIPAARYPWLVILLIAATVAAAVLGPRLGARALLPVLLLLTLAEGARGVAWMELLPGKSTWAIPSRDFPNRRVTDTQARALAGQLQDPPRTRPARLPDQKPELALHGGTPGDAMGFLGLDYHLGDYGGAITTARRKISEEPALRELMLRPWTAWVWSCDEVDCSRDTLRLPDVAGRESTSVETSSYGLDSIRYRVRLDTRSLMVENEIYGRGWSALGRKGIERVSIDDILRGWVLPAGNYEFTASYELPERRAQLWLTALALGSFCVSALLFLLARRSR